MAVISSSLLMVATSAMVWTPGGVVRVAGGTIGCGCGFGVGSGRFFARSASWSSAIGSSVVACTPGRAVRIVWMSDRRSCAVRPAVVAPIGSAKHRCVPRAVGRPPAGRRLKVRVRVRVLGAARSLNGVGAGMSASRFTCGTSAPR